MEVLRQLPVEGVSEPLDSLFGFEILQRRMPGPPVSYAMDALMLTFNPASPADASDSRAAISRLAASLLKSLREDGSRFEQLQRSYCCEGTLRLTQTYEYPEAHPVLSRIAMGEIALAAIESGNQFIIPRRADPARLPRVEVRKDLGFAERPDVAFWLSQLDGAAGRQRLKRLGDESSGSLSLSDDQAVQFRSLHANPWPPMRDANSSEEREQELQQMLERVRHLLGPDRYDTYLRYVEGDVERMVLSAPK